MAETPPQASSSSSGQKHRLDFTVAEAEPEAEPEPEPEAKWQKRTGTRAWFSLSSHGGAESGNGALFFKAGEDDDLDTLTSAVHDTSLPCDITAGVIKSNLTPTGGSPATPPSARGKGKGSGGKGGGKGGGGGNASPEKSPYTRVEMYSYPHFAPCVSALNRQLPESLTVENSGQVSKLRQRTLSVSPESPTVLIVHGDAAFPLSGYLTDLLFFGAVRQYSQAVGAAYAINLPTSTGMHADETCNALFELAGKWGFLFSYQPLSNTAPPAAGM